MNILQTIAKAVFYRPYWKQRGHAIASRLALRTGLQNFMDGFYDRFNWQSTVGIIREAVNDGYLSWEDVGYSEKELDDFYREHINGLFHTLYWSLQPENRSAWKFSRNAIYALERFRRFAEQSEHSRYRDHAHITEAFTSLILELLKYEYAGATDAELNERFRAEQASFLTTGAFPV